MTDPSTPPADPAGVNDTSVENEPLYLPWLCGQEEPFWSSGVSWETSNPTLSSCLRKASWTFPPFLIFWLILPWEIRKLFRSTSRDIPLTFLGVSRVLAALFLLLIAIIDLFFWALDEEVSPS